MKANQHFDHISLNFSQIEKCFEQILDQNKFVFIFSPKTVPFMR
jgi:hypothetical protein